MRQWIINLIREAVFKSFTDLEIRVDLLTAEVAAARSMSERLLNAYQSESYAREIEKSSRELENDAKPLAQSRSSWPRMKKHFEEEDVRRSVAAAKDFTSTRQAFNEEADRVAKYWTNKGA